MENELSYYMTWLEVYFRCALKINSSKENSNAVEDFRTGAREEFTKGNLKGLKSFQSDLKKELKYERPQTKLFISIELYKELHERNERLELQIIKEMKEIFKSKTDSAESKKELLDLWNSYNSLIGNHFDIEWKLL